MALPSGRLNALVEQLGRLGLTATEAKAYLAAIKLGPSTPVQIAHEAGLQRSEIYRLMSRLVSMGLVEETIDRPRRYRPIVIKDGVRSLAERVVGQLRTALGDSESLAARLEALAGTTRAASTSEIRVVAGLSNTQKAFLEQAAAAENEAWMILGPQAVMRPPRYYLATAYKTLASRHLRVRAVIEVNHENVKRIKKLPEFVEVRHFGPLDLYVYGFDSRCVGLDLTPAAGDIRKSSQLVVTHEPFVRIMHHLFEAIWSMATPLSVQLSRLEGKHVPVGHTQIIWGRQEIYQKMSDWHTKAKEEIVGLSSMQGPPRVLASFRQLCLDARKRDIRVRLICRLSPENVAAVKELCEIIEVRRTDFPGAVAVALLDQSEAVMTFVEPDSAETRGLGDMSVYTTDRHIVRELRRFYDYIWANSVPVEVSELLDGQGRSAGNCGR